LDKNHAKIINFYLQKNIFRDIILKKFYEKQGLTKITAENLILSKQASKQASKPASKHSSKQASKQ